MRRIYEPGSLMEAEMLRGMLASEGIDVHLMGRDLVGGIGDLPLHGLLALSVPDDQANDARALIDAYTTAQPLAGDEPDALPGILIC